MSKQETSPTPADSGLDENSDQSLAARRRFLRGGVAASPVVLTVVSPSVMATGLTCRTASVYASISLQVSGSRTSATCNGLSPGYWKNQSYWPSPYKSGQSGQTPATKFRTYFTTAQSGTPFPTDSSGVVQTTFRAIINEPYAAWSTALNRAVVATALNIAAGYVPPSVLTLPQLQTMWTATATGGTYNIPGVGISWTAAQVVTYLQTTYS
jgi:hypothetical protein